MSDALTDALPLPNRIPRRRTAETTAGGRESVRWVAVAENLQPLEANIVRGRLESADIPAMVYQEAIGAVMGLTVGPLGSAKVLVPEPVVEAALAILAETFEPEGDEEDIPETEKDE
ncbi:MAG: hypothetical protein D6796_10880 [Caldilineae bacterium]|nr:MAG: hypothetical protein D6796_10880 [Caldilineae bacterium]